ncbi:cytochrome b-c1 complex subunit 10 [Umbelopsis sp. PMI_123]|nr:cytochrome b-c1 complex subunit 10 [Umbelopsis sp. PMI_123]
MPAPKIATVPSFGFITPEKLIRVAPSAAVWGAAAGAAVLLLGSDIPIIKRDILSKFPVVGSYWAVDAPAQDEE